MSHLFNLPSPPTRSLIDIGQVLAHALHGLTSPVGGGQAGDSIPINITKRSDVPSEPTQGHDQVEGPMAQG